MNQTNKVFIISLDGATFDVLRPLARQGYLPNLNRLFQEALAAELESVIPPVTAPAWTSFMTGKQPSRHGIFDFTRYDHATTSWKINNAQHIRSKTLWQIVSEQGKRVVVLSLPYTYPPYEVNGILVAGWDAPTTRAFTYPASLREKIFEIVPDYGSDLDLTLWNYLPATSNAEFNSFIHKLVRSAKQTAELASHFVASEDWDVFMAHFQQTDWIQHKLWGHIEKACTDANDKSERVEAVRQCYQEFDRLVGSLLASARAAGAIQIVLSDHGFGAYRGLICPNYFLKQWGYFQLQNADENAIKRLVKNSRIAGVRKFYRLLARTYHSFQGKQATRKYKSWADMVSEASPQDRFPVDWSRTRVAALAGSEMGFLYVNRDQDSHGAVQAGAEYDKLLSDLIARFQELSDPGTGRKLLTQVVKGRDVYPTVGEGVVIPDLVLIPVEGYVFSTSVLDGFTPEVSGEGNHRHNGVLFMGGNGIKRQVDAFRPRLLDLAPTVLHMLGLEVPEDMDGRVLQEALTNPGQIRYGKAEQTAAHEAVDYSEEDSELIAQRLRGLGYVE